MPSGRSIPRPPSTRPRKPKPPDEAPEVSTDVAKAGGELVSLASRIRACTACDRACPDRAYGTGYPRAPIMLVKERPSAADAEAGEAFVEEGEALAKAFAALGIPLSWIYGATSVRCGSSAATSDQTKACAEHLLVEIEAVLPRVLVVCGAKAFDAVRVLDGRCGLHIPDEIATGERLVVRSDLTLIVTEPLPEGVTQKEPKRRLWRDLQLIPDILRD
jgi:uracil-DNA glycosylase family 4